MHHPVADGHQAQPVEVLAGLGQQIERQTQRSLMVGDPAVAAELLLPDVQLGR